MKLVWVYRGNTALLTSEEAANSKNLFIIKEEAFIELKKVGYLSYRALWLKQSPPLPHLNLRCCTNMEDAVRRTEMLYKKWLERVRIQITRLEDALTFTSKVTLSDDAFD